MEESAKHTPAEMKLMSDHSSSPPSFAPSTNNNVDCIANNGDTVVNGDERAPKKMRLIPSPIATAEGEKNTNENKENKRADYDNHNALSLALDLRPELFFSDELGVISQTCCVAHHFAVREATKRWKAIGWETVPYPQVEGNEPKFLLPYGLQNMGLFPRVTTSRVFEGLVVATQTKLLCCRLQAMGATVIETSSFAESLTYSDRIDFCVWSGSSRPPRKAEIVTNHQQNQNSGDKNDSIMSVTLSSSSSPPPPPVVIWELPLWSFLFAPWVSIPRLGFHKIRTGKHLTDEQVEELLRIEEIKEFLDPESLRNWGTENFAGEDFILNLSLKTYINVLSGDIVRAWTYATGRCGRYFYQQSDQETQESVPCLDICDFDPSDCYSWQPGELGPNSSERDCICASIGVLGSGLDLRLGYVATSYLFGIEWVRDWSFSAAAPSCNISVSKDRAERWKECLQELKTAERISTSMNQLFLYKKEDYRKPRSFAPCAAVLRWTWALSFDV